jgi:tetratricopeptide (TPR) repeat protein
VAASALPILCRHRPSAPAPSLRDGAPPWLITRFLAPALLLTLAGALGAAVQPAPATIQTNDQPIDNVWVIQETIDGVDFYLGDPRDRNTAVPSSRKRGQYTRVVYGAAEDGNFLRGMAMSEGTDADHFEKAAAAFKQAIGSAKYQWEIEDSYLRSAECFARANKPDEALALLKEFGDKCPKSVRQAEMIEKRARMRLLKGDRAGANEDFGVMVKNAETWGKSFAVAGQLGLASVLRLDKKYPDTIKLLGGLLDRLPPETQADDFALVGLVLADDQIAAEKKAEAMATCRRLYLAPIATEAQCRARLKVARLLAAGTTTADTLTAFDHAALAVVLGPDGETEAAAVKLVKDLAKRIDGDKSISDVDKREYRVYSNF